MFDPFNMFDPFGSGRRRTPDLAALFGPSDVGILFEPQRRDTLWQDAAGATPVTTYGQGIQRMSDRSGGNRHATQANAASALIYGRHPASGVRNLLTNSAMAGAAAGTPGVAPTGWTMSGVPGTIVSVADGGISLSATASRPFLITPFIAIAAGQTLMGSFEVTAVSAGMTIAELVSCSEFPVGSAAFYRVNGAVVAGSTVVNAGDIAAISLSSPTNAGSMRFRFGLGCSSAVTGTLDMRWPQVEDGVVRTAYQRVGSVYDVTEAGKSDCYYGLCDGADNSLATAAFAWGSDKVYLCAAVRKNSDVAVGMIAEFSPSIASNNGAFALQAPASAAANYTFAAKGTIASTASYTNAAVAAPNTAVIECIADIAADRCEIWVDGVLVATAAGDQGTGAFGTFALNIGRRAGSSLPFNGLLYGLMGLNRLPSDAERAVARRLMAAKQGRTL